jgi:hypothetical protein
MTARIPENVSTWLVDWSIVTIMGNTMPPRDPNDDDDDDETEDEDGDAEPDDDLEPAVENPTNSPHAPQLSPRKLTSPAAARTLPGVSLLDVLGGTMASMAGSRERDRGPNSSGVRGPNSSASKLGSSMWDRPDPSPQAQN